MCTEANIPPLRLPQARRTASVKKSGCLSPQRQLASRPRRPALHKAFLPPGWLRAGLALQLQLLPCVGSICSLHLVAPAPVPRVPQAPHQEACPGLDSWPRTFLPGGPSSPGCWPMQGWGQRLHSAASGGNLPSGKTSAKKRGHPDLPSAETGSKVSLTSLKGPVWNLK